MAKNICYGAKQVLDQMSQGTFTAHSPVVLTDNQEQQRLNQKRWNTAYKLWKLKSAQPHLFSNINRMQQEQQSSAVQSAAAAGIPGLARVRSSGGEMVRGWLHHSERQFYFEEATERCLWLDNANGGVYRDLHVGNDLTAELTLSGLAATAGGSSASSAAPRGTASVGAAGAHPSKHIVIVDLHKAAEIFKLDITHLDRPASMLAVYKYTANAVPPDVAAKGLHEKLLRRLAAHRSMWSDEALQAGLVECISALAMEHSASAGIAGCVALVLGGKLFAAAAHGAGCMIADSLPDDMRDVRAAVSSSAESGRMAISSACVDLDSRSAVCLLLYTESAGEASARTAAAHVVKGRLRAGAVMLLQGMQPVPAIGRAAACAQLAWSCDDGDDRPAKRARAARPGQGEKVRVRQILLRYVGCKQATDPVRRKAVRRSLAEAESAMLQVLTALDEAKGSGGGTAAEAAFTHQCRASSECTSSLKGGDLAGDVGWLKLPEIKPGEKVSREVADRMVVIRAALALEVGEVSDILVSEQGVHLLKRSA